MTTTTTYPDLRSLTVKVRELAGREPTRTASCHYTVNDDGSDDPETARPECIVGVALVELGVPIETLVDDGRPIDEHYLDGYPELIDGEEDENRLEWLRRVQSEQDWGRTWGYAVESADQYFGPVA